MANPIPEDILHFVCRKLGLSWGSEGAMKAAAEELLPTVLPAVKPACYIINMPGKTCLLV